MYKLSRLMLVLAVGLFYYSLVVMAGVAGVMFGPPGVIAVVVLVVGVVVKKRARLFTAFGTARFADESDLAGMLDAKQGLILGRIAGNGKLAAGKGMKALVSRRIAAKDACRQFLEGMASKRRRRNGRLVKLPNAVHSAIFAPTGVGKGVSCVIPFLLTCDESCVVVDFKGELAAIAAAARRRMGHGLVLLDPFKVVTQQPDTYNPLDFIEAGSALSLDECRDLAEALVIRTGEEKDPHWPDSAEAVISGLIATTVHYGLKDKGSRSLQAVRDLLSHPQKWDMVIKLMCGSDAWGGMLARMGGQLTHFRGDELGSTMTTTNRFLRFLDTLAIAESTKASSFDPAEFARGKLSVFLILPPEHARACSPLLRVWIGSLLRAVVRGGLQEKNKVHFVLDEAATLGHLQSLDDAVDKYRSYGIRLQCYYQSLGQLKLCWPQGRDQTLLSNTTQVFFGANDPQTCDFISARLGEETIVVESGGTSEGGSQQVSQGSSHSQSNGSSWNRNANWQQHARKLLKPEEVAALPPRVAITFTPGVPPIRTTLVRYFEEPGLFAHPSWRGRLRAACGTFIASAVLLTGAALLAASLTCIAVSSQRTPTVPQPIYIPAAW